MNQITGIRTTAIAGTALVVAIVALALAWVAYDRTSANPTGTSESSLNQSSDLEESLETGSRLDADRSLESSTVPQSQP